MTSTVAGRPTGPPSGSPSTSSDDRQARLADPRDERRDRPDAGLRGEPTVRRVVAESTEEPAKLGHRLAARCLDGEQGLFGRVRRASNDLAGRARLDDHDADPVGDDVVQLAGHVPALLGRGRRQPLLSIAERAFRFFIAADRLEAARPNDVADQP